MIKSSTNRWPHTGAILTGGKSLRMGKPKLNLRFEDGKTMLQHVFESMSDFCEQTVLTGVPSEFEIESLTWVPRIEDKRRGLGPLAGIEALLSREMDSSYVVVGCDQPLLNTSLFEKLVQGDLNRPHFFYNKACAKFHMLPLYVPQSALRIIEEQFSRGEYSIKTFLHNANAQTICIDYKEELLLENINTPQDFSRISKFTELNHAPTCR